MSLTTAVAAQFKLIIRKECMAGPQWNGGCVFHLTTAVLGYCLIIVVALAQIPLLYKILRYKEAETYTSKVSIGVMAFIASNNVAYAVNKNLPISTWGEGVIEIILCLIIINLLLIYQGSHKIAVAFTLVYVTVMVGSLTPVVPAKIIMFLKLLNMPLDIIRKIVLIYQSHRQGTPVSPVSSHKSIALLSLCSLGRCLTACVHSHDVLLIVAYGQECLCTLALSTVAMVLRRRWKKNLKANLKGPSIVEECLEAYSSNSSDGEELVYSGDGDDDEEERLTRRRRWRRKMRKVLSDEEEREDGREEGKEDDRWYFSEVRRKRRKLRRTRLITGFGLEDWDGEMSSSYSSGLDECLKTEWLQKGS